MNRPHRIGRLVAVVVAVLVAAGVAGYFWYGQRDRLPGPGAPVYEQYVEAFEMGLAGLDANLTALAEEDLTRAVGLIPQEPAGWIDRALLYLKQQRLDQARHDLDEAQRLTPGNAAVEKLLGMVEQDRTHFTAAREHFQRAWQLDPRDTEAIYHLAKLVDLERVPDSDAEYQRLMDEILKIEPENLVALKDRLMVAARRQDVEALRDTVRRLKPLFGSWPQEIRSEFAALEQMTAAPAVGEQQEVAVQRFSNLLMRVPGYARAASALYQSNTLANGPVRRFLRLSPPRSAPSEPDADLTFLAEPVPEMPEACELVLPAWLTIDGPPTILAMTPRELRVGSRSTLASRPAAPHGVVPIDWNNDFRTDLLLAGSAGLKFYEQKEDGSFADVTGRTELPAAVLGGDYHAAWTADIDLDGDLDILLARKAGPPLLLRNNFNGTFTPLSIFTEVEGARAFAWADLDHDGAPDAALLDSQGVLHVYANERSGRFIPWPVKPSADARFAALAAADVNDDGVLDLVAVRADGTVLRISDRDRRAAWDTLPLAKHSLPADIKPGEVRLMIADIDNNGVADLVVSDPGGTSAWLGEGAGRYAALASPLPARVFAAVDVDGDGRLDLLGLDPGGRPIRLLNRGKKDYHWQAVRPRAARGGKVEGDNRINSFAIGGELEARVGSFVVKQPITQPVVHFGLGSRPQIDVVRFTWPNGVSQVEIKPRPDQVSVAEQRLSGSCPFLFTWNGEKFVFVTDFLWSSPLGMYISAQDKGGFLQTTDWVRIRGDQLVPRDGSYEVRINANLWETHFFDHLSLRVVDHPADTEMFVDERFYLEPTAASYQLTARPRPVAHAWDHHGRQVTEIVSKLDAVYLDRAGRGAYQGITRDHWVEFDLGPDAPDTGPLWLIAHGWLHPTDSSVNFAIEQGRHDRPQPLVLETPDGKGGWKVWRDRLGFPAGKNKTILVRLDRPDQARTPRRFRLRTNMEIFWDALHHAAGRSDIQAIERSLLPDTAELRFRGILEMTQANRSSPELPHYDRIVSKGQHWRDLIGYHTRHGDVRELLTRVDDRYVIACAGDELVLRFRASDPPPAGWKRDFIWISDGWVKDGNLNTRHSKTVLPLPCHDMKSYEAAPGRLEDDPVYRRFPNDWNVFHTRHVTPQGYEQGLRGCRARAHVTRSRP